MSMYYFLISGLPDLLVGNRNDSHIFSPADFLSFCEGQMSAKDFAALKKIYILNDIKNVISDKSDEVFVEPSYYSKEEFDENRKDPDTFFPFIADYYQDMKSERRLYPQMTAEDELIARFYADLDGFAAGNDFLREYFRFELVLRNVLTIANMRKAGEDPADYVITTEDFGDNIVKSSSPDLGLGADYPFVAKINELVDSGDLVQLEESLDKIRFDYIDNLIGYDTFSLNVVMAYGIKLLCAYRWQSLSAEKGRAIFEQIIAQIRENIKFSDEFSVVGGKR